MGAPPHLSLAETTLRLGVASIFGAVIGFEREVDGHDAGMRTHILLALGAAVFGTLSVGAFDVFLAPRNTTDVSFDPSRIASYVAAGIGFLGGGAIIKRDDGVKGLTTAASLWVVAAVGLAAGLGFWRAATVGSGIALVVLVAERPLRRDLSRRQDFRQRRS
jgi:putative Mg2+ transporter-C (MgtC) family protein